MTTLEIVLLDAVRSALRVRELQRKYAKAGPLSAKEVRSRLFSEQRLFNQLADRALAAVDETVRKGEH